MTIAAFDLTTFQAFHIDPAASPGLETLAEFVATWGIGLVPAVLAGLWLLDDRASRSAGVVAALGGILALMLAGALSFAIYTPRPFTEGLAENVLHHVADSSFPSDHMAVLGAAVFALALGRCLRTALMLGLAAVAVGWARIALGIHFPSDILAGLGLGALAALLFQTTPLTRFVRFVRQIAEAVAGPVRYDIVASRLALLKHREH